jgi:hypothetical protein
MAAQHYYSHKELEGKNGSEKQDVGSNREGEHVKHSLTLVLLSVIHRSQMFLPKLDASP